MIIPDLIFFGCFGMFAEIVFTAITRSYQNKSLNLMGHVSLWMFPVYAIGLTWGFDLIEYLISNDIFRWLSYPLWIWLVEISIGVPASKKNIEIWNYRYLPDWAHWRGIISFVHFPLWVLFGILVECFR